MSALWCAGWKRTGAHYPEHEVSFEASRDALLYIRDELSWMAADLPTADPVGDEAIAAAKEIAGVLPQGGVHYYGWAVGVHTYYAKRNEEEAKRREAGGKWL